MAEEEQHPQDNSPSLQSMHKSSQDERKNIHELRNQDYVSRLLAATPPYLYSAPVGPNNFFFSDMLRSLVQARNNENMRNLQMQQAAVLARRPRKRSWSHHRPYYEHLRERKGVDENLSASEKPLELTNKQFVPMSAVKYAKTDQSVKESTCSKIADPNFKENQNALQDSSSTVSVPSQDVPLPPPPPVWYPPIYPPYGIDPLHFFIDLRVSGHIYDRKKENISPLANAESNTLHPTETSTPGKHRHGSAFTVPLPRNEAKSTTAINLSSSSSSMNDVSGKLDDYSKFYDTSETKENNPSPKNNSDYVLQNLPRLYSQFTGIKDMMEDGGGSLENDNKSDQDFDDSADEHHGTEYKENSTHIDVEILDSTKFHNDGNSSQCGSPASCNISHQKD